MDMTLHGENQLTASSSGDRRIVFRVYDGSTPAYRRELGIVSREIGRSTARVVRHYAPWLSRVWSLVDENQYLALGPVEYVFEINTETTLYSPVLSHEELKSFLDAASS